MGDYNYNAPSERYARPREVNYNTSYPSTPSYSGPSYPSQTYPSAQPYTPSYTVNPPAPRQPVAPRQAPAPRQQAYVNPRQPSEPYTVQRRRYNSVPNNSYSSGRSVARREPNHPSIFDPFAGVSELFGMVPRPPASFFGDKDPFDDGFFGDRKSRGPGGIFGGGIGSIFGNMDKMLKEAESGGGNGYFAAKSFSSSTYYDKNGNAVTVNKGMEKDSTGRARVAHQQRIGDRHRTIVKERKDKHSAPTTSQYLNNISHEELPMFENDWRKVTQKSSSLLSEPRGRPPVPRNPQPAIMPAAPVQQLPQEDYGRWRSVSQ